MSERCITITAAVVSAMEEHARGELPKECCGLLGGPPGGAITDAYPLRNEAEKPETRYFAEPGDLFVAMRRMRETGRALLGIYHSHPKSPARPSPTDVEMAFYPEAVYFIMSFASGFDLRAFTIVDARVEPVQISVIDAAAKDGRRS